MLVCIYCVFKSSNYHLAIQSSFRVPRLASNGACFSRVARKQGKPIKWGFWGEEWGENPQTYTFD